MLYYGEGVQTAHAAMLPDGTEIWEQSLLPEYGAVAYVAPDCPDGLAKKVIAFAANGNPVQDMEYINGGDQADVYSYGNYAIKIGDNFADAARPGGIHDVVANLGLSVGLERRGYKNQPTSFMLKAPRVYVAVVPQDSWSETVERTYAMDFVPGSVPRSWLRLPSRTERQARYREALATVGINPNKVSFDESPHNTNLLVGDTDAAVHQDLTKIDLLAMGHFMPQPQ